MKQHVAGKARALMITGMSVLTVSSTMLTRPHNDFIYGLGFGIGIGLLMLGIYNLRRQ